MLIVNRKSLMFILVSVLIGFSTYGSYAQWGENPTITASTGQPLTETTLDGSVVTLTLSNGTYERWLGLHSVMVSGILGVTIGSFSVDRVSDTKIAFALAFDGDLNFDMTLTFTVFTGAIENYHGPALTTSVRVRAVEESLIASVSVPWRAQRLTEKTLDGSVVVLTLKGRHYERWFRWDPVTVSGIKGVTIGTKNPFTPAVKRVSDSTLSVALEFDGNFDTDKTLTFTVDADAIVGYKGPPLTAEIRVSAVREPPGVSMAAPAMKATLDGSIITLKLTSGTYTRQIEWGDVRVSGIFGVTIDPFGVKRVSDRKVTVKLKFNDNLHANAILKFATLTLTVDAKAIVGYNGPPLTAEIHISEIKTSLNGSTKVPLTETNLHGSGVILALNGHSYEERIRRAAVTVSGIKGVAIENYYVRISDTKIGIVLVFSGDFDTDKTLTFTISADAIKRYNGPALTAQIPVTASVEQDPSTQEQITARNYTLQGPWLWMMTDGSDIASDYLNLESGGAVTEAQVAQNGVNAGDVVGRFQWTSGRITTPVKTCKKFCRGTLFERCTALCWSNNINKTFNTIGFGKWRNITEHTAYAIINLVSPRDQRDVMLSVGSGDAIKVWLNGEVVHRAAETELGCREVPVPRTLVCTPDPSSPKMNSVPVTLKAGDNFLLVKVSQHGEYWDMEIRLNADFTTAIPTAKTTKASTLALSDAVVPNNVGESSPPQVEDGQITEPIQLKEDVNGDGIVNTQDLVLVASNLGQVGQHFTDVNGDGLVNIADLILVAGALGTSAAPSFLNSQTLTAFTTTDIKLWLSQAQHLPLTDATSQSGVLFLAQLLEAITPKETTLLPNYPNPFNPETWIPYQLAKDADVTLTIYAVNGRAIRRLTLGHQHAGTYQTRSRAAYWDGRNEFDEPVASGLYFYTLTAGNFTATRKMLIRK